MTAWVMYLLGLFFFLLVCLLFIKKIVMAKLYAVVGGELLH